MAEREVVGWFTLNGQHIPILKGESKKDAYNRAVANKNEDTKQKQIAKNKEQADKLNGKSKSVHRRNGVEVSQKEHDDSQNVKATEKSLERNKADKPDTDWGKYVTFTYRVVKNQDGSAMLYRTNQQTGKTTSQYYSNHRDALSDATRRRNSEKKSAMEAMKKAQSK